MYEIASLIAGGTFFVIIACIIYEDLWRFGDIDDEPEFQIRRRDDDEENDM